jgi:tRNA (guanine10-N2)-dimethyltransferase
VASKVGAILAKRSKIDLESPEVEVRILMSDTFQFFICDRRIDRKQFDERKVALRPFFSPISLHPRFARALVNLSRVRKGGRLLDPFCGTGGITIEAALIGAKVIGSDISQEMVDGCKENMAHFRATWEAMKRVDIGSISEVFGKVDAIVTDPPYGRSATTNKEPPLDLHERALNSMADALKEGGNLAVVFPELCLKGRQDLELRETHTQRIHRSLTRHYCIFTKRLVF